MGAFMSRSGSEEEAALLGSINDSDRRNDRYQSISSGLVTSLPGQHNVEIADGVVVSIPLSDLSNNSKLKQSQEQVISSIDSKAVANLLFADALEKVLEENGKGIGESTDQEEPLPITGLLSHIDNFDAAPKNIKRLLLQLQALIIDGQPYEKVKFLPLERKIIRDPALLKALLKYFLSQELQELQELQEHELKQVYDFLFSSEHINPVVPLKIQSTTQAIELAAKRNKQKHMHMAGAPSSESVRLQATIDEYAELVWQMLAAAAGTTAAVLFYPAVAKKLKPFFISLGLTEDQADFAVLLLQIGSSAANALWNSSLTHIARKLLIENLIKPLLTLVINTREFSKKDASKIFYSFYLALGGFSFALGMNYLVTPEDFEKHWHFIFSVIINCVSMIPATDGAYNFFYKKLRNYLQTQALIEMMLKTADKKYHKMATALRYLQYQTETLKNSTPWMLKFYWGKFGWNPYRWFTYQLFDPQPLRKAIGTLRDFDYKNFYYKSQQDQVAEQLEMVHAVGDIKSAPSTSITNSNLFRGFLWLLSGASVFGYAIKSVLISDENDAEFSMLQKVFFYFSGILGGVGLIINEGRFSWHIADDLRGPTLLKYIGGATNNIANATNAALFLVCLLSGAGTGAAMYEVLTVLKFAFWLVAIGTIYCMAFGGFSNAFAIKTYLDDVSKTVITIAASATGNVHIQNLCVNFKRFTSFVDEVLSGTLTDTLLEEAQQELLADLSVTDKTNILERSYFMLLFDTVKKWRYGNNSQSNGIRATDIENPTEVRDSATKRPLLTTMLNSINPKTEKFFEGFKENAVGSIEALRSQQAFNKAFTPLVRSPIPA